MEKKKSNVSAVYALDSDAPQNTTAELTSAEGRDVTPR
jgi:hypothetical protein